MTTAFVFLCCKCIHSADAFLQSELQMRKHTNMSDYSQAANTSSAAVHNTHVHALPPFRAGAEGLWVILQQSYNNVLFYAIMCAQACVCLLSRKGNKLMLIEWLMTARMRDSLMRPTRVEIKCQLVAQIKFPSFHQSPAHISLPSLENYC